MKSRTTLFLILFVILAGGVVFYDLKNGKPTEIAIAEAKRIVPFKAGDITGIELIQSNRTVLLVKSNDLWNITKPLAVRADSGAVQAILDDLELGERKRLMTAADLADANLADFGLVAPRVRAVFTGKSGTTTVLVGVETPTKDALYIQLKGDPGIMVVDRSIHDRLNSSLDTLRSHIAVDFTPSAVTRIELKSKDRVIELTKTTGTEPHWLITKPIAARADQSKISELLTGLSSLRVADFVSEDPKDLHLYQLDEPCHEMTIWLGDAGKTFLIGASPTNDANKVYAKLKSADTIITIPAAAAGKFAPPINDLRDPHVLAFNRDEVRGIELARPTGKITVAREGDTWKLTAPVPMNADDEAVGQLLDNLAELSAVQFVVDVATPADLQKYGITTPSVTVTLQGQGTNVLAQLLVGGADSTTGVRFVKRASEPFVFGLEPGKGENLPASALALRSRQIGGMPADKVVKLTLQKGATKAVLERDPQNKWKLAEPVQGVFDPDALQQILDVLANLRAQEFIREGRENLAEFGLDKPEFVATLQAGTNQTWSVSLGKSRDPQTRYAMTAEPPLVFVLPAPVVNTITKDIVKTTPAATTNTPPATPAP